MSNDVSVGDLDGDGNPTGAWTPWVTQNVTVTLVNGTVNTVRFESNGQDLANIDQLEVL